MSLASAIVTHDVQSIWKTFVIVYQNFTLDVFSTVGKEETVIAMFVNIDLLLYPSEQLAVICWYKGQKPALWSSPFLSDLTWTQSLHS
ncbi:hypothetical protein J6590_011921 [Homalodisca vitripennis]|nr:hypothetical protein J6590_011921 [Homalodisca vitripennis]